MATGAPVNDTESTPEAAARRPNARGRLGYEHRYTDGGPKGRLLSGTMGEYGADPVASMRRWRDDYGDFVPIRFGPFRAHVAFGPAEIEEVLVDRPRTSGRASGPGC